MKKDSFVFYTEWFQSIDELPPEVRLEVYDAIKVYVTTGEVPAEAERKGFQRRLIAKCCNGKRKHHGGYEWKYAD